MTDSRDRLDGVARQGLIVFAAQMAVNLSNFLFHAFISRRIGVEQYGALNALVSAFNIFSVVAVVLTTVVAKTVAELRAGDADGRIRGFALRAMMVLSAVAAIAMLLGTAFAPAIASYLQIRSPLAVVLTAGILAVNFLLPMRGVLQGAELFGSYSVSLVLEAVLKVALAVAFVSFGFGLGGALGGWLAGAAIALLYTLAIGTLKYGHTEASKYTIDYRRIGAATAGIVVAALLLSIMQFSDVIIVKHFLNPRAAGLYAAAALSGRMLFLLVNFVPIVLLPHAVKAEHSKDGPGKLLVLAIAVVLGLSLAGLVLYALVPATIVGTLAGAAFRPASPLLLPYGVAATVFAVLNTIVTFRIGIHRLQFIAPLAIVAALEVGGIWLLHASPLQVILVLIAGNATGVLACFYKIRERSLAYA